MRVCARTIIPSDEHIIISIHHSPVNMLLICSDAMLYTHLHKIVHLKWIKIIRNKPATVKSASYRDSRLPRSSAQ